MNNADLRSAYDSARVLITGANGQDGRFLVAELAAAGAEVHALVRNAAAAQHLAAPGVTIHECTIGRGGDAERLIAGLQPDHIFNLAGMSSVRESLDKPELSWTVNADWVVRLLELVRTKSPRSRVYQASSSEMFGWQPGGESGFDEETPLRPASPYAAGKASAHMLCGIYRRVYGVRVACGILFNHESKFRSSAFLTWKVAAHVRGLRERNDVASAEPLTIGNLSIRRDWGYSAEFASAMALICAQVAVRNRRNGTNEPDEPQHYRDYVVGTGVLTSVQELVDAAFGVAGFPLDWNVDAPDPADWTASFRGTNRIAVRSDRAFFRVAEPAAIRANPGRVRDELGWRATAGVREFLEQMILDRS